MASSDPQWGEIRGQFYSLALGSHSEIADIHRSDDKVLFRLQNRIGELWRPLLTVAAFLDRLEDNGLVGLIQRVQDQHSEDVAATAFEPLESALAGALLTLITGESSLLTSTQVADRMKERFLTSETTPHPVAVGKMIRRLNLGHPRRTANDRQYLVFLAEVLDFLKRARG